MLRSGNHTEKSSRSRLIVFSLILCLLVGILSLYGMLEPYIYAQETPNWQIQSSGQDFINLVLPLPLLAVAVVFMTRRNDNGILLALGAIAYLAYTYVIYCFSLHFNVLFIPYCLVLGLCFFSMAQFLASPAKPSFRIRSHPILHKVTGIYFIITSVLFFFLWTSEIVSAQLEHTVPQSLIDTGLFTNPVHVLDLSIVLPAIFLSGLMLLKSKKMGTLLAPVVLTFFVLMDMTIGTLNMMMSQAGIPTQPIVATIMYSKGLFSLILLFFHLKTTEKEIVT